MRWPPRLSSRVKALAERFTAHKKEAPPQPEEPEFRMVHFPDRPPIQAQHGDIPSEEECRELILTMKMGKYPHRDKGKGKGKAGSENLVEDDALSCASTSWRDRDPRVSELSSLDRERLWDVRAPKGDAAGIVGLQVGECSTSSSATPRRETRRSRAASAGRSPNLETLPTAASTSANKQLPRSGPNGDAASAQPVPPFSTLCYICRAETPSPRGLCQRCDEEDFCASMDRLYASMDMLSLAQGGIGPHGMRYADLMSYSPTTECEANSRDADKARSDTVKDGGPLWREL